MKIRIILAKVVLVGAFVLIGWLILTINQELERAEATLDRIERLLLKREKEREKEILPIISQPLQLQPGQLLQRQPPPFWAANNR